MPTDQSLTLTAVLTAGGAVAAAAFVTGFVEVIKRLAPVFPNRDWEFRLAALLSALLVVAAYASGVQAGSLVITPETAFAGLLAWYGIAKLSAAIYDEAATRLAPDAPPPAPAPPLTPHPTDPTP